MKREQLQRKKHRRVVKEKILKNKIHEQQLIQKRIKEKKEDELLRREMNELKSTLPFENPIINSNPLEEPPPPLSLSLKNTYYRLNKIRHHRRGEKEH